MKNELYMLVVFCSTNETRQLDIIVADDDIVVAFVAGYRHRCRLTFSCIDNFQLSKVMAMNLWTLISQLAASCDSSSEYCDADNDERCTPRSRQIKFNLHFSIKSRSEKRTPSPQRIEILGSHVNTIDDAVNEYTTSRYCECACSRIVYDFLHYLWLCAMRLSTRNGKPAKCSRRSLRFN